MTDNDNIAHVEPPQPFDEANLRRLEFDKIKAIFKTFARSEPAKLLMDTMYPITDAAEIRRLLDETGEMMVIVYRGDTVPIDNTRDIRASLKRARVVDSILQPEELKDIQAVLEVSRNLRKFFATIRGEFPLLKAWSNELFSLVDVEKDISRSIGPDMSVLDTASPELRRIRAEIGQVHDRIHARMEQFVSSAEIQTLLQENFISERNGRPVVLVRAECKRQVPGIVHDTSRSGGAVYLEPMPVVHLTNEQEELRGREREEIHRVLRKLTAQVRKNGACIEQTAAVIAYFDFLHAKAQAARVFKMQIPTLNTRGALHLRDARHPMLMTAYDHLRKHGFLGEVSAKGVVPIDVHLGENYDMLVITGPNTGGKTVALKTVGLLSLMVQSGLPIPAKGTSDLPIYEGIYCDIGDEQSIEQNLSTFSSHITHIAQILAVADKRSLVLLDELGAGTDPEEGASLGRAILEELHKRWAKVIITTHLTSLKEFAYATPRTENASVEFDVSTLRPTFRLLTGVPGASSALIIAERCGIPKSVIDRAEKSLGTQHFEVQELIAKMKESHRELSDKMQQETVQTAQPPPASYAAPVDTWQVLSNLKPGDPVYVRGWDVRGKALAIDVKKKRVQVELGRMRMEVNADDIFLVSGVKDEEED